MNESAAYRVTVGEHEFDVTIELQDGEWFARLGDETWPVAWLARGPHLATLRVDATRVEVAIAATAGGWWLAIDGYEAEAAVVEARALRLAATLPHRAAQVGRIEVRAPMPGRVVAVRVEPGAQVERGALVAILEAMKMENELRAPQAGRVVEVRVAAGDTVEHGALLVVLEPPAEAGDSAQASTPTSQGE